MDKLLSLRGCGLHRLVVSAAIAVLLYGGSNSATAQSLTSYHVGNSLTWDARVGDGLPPLAADAGLQLTTGYHIRCGNSLDYITANPNDTCVTPNSFGSYTDAFANHTWDAITLQPFSASTPRQEYLAFKTLVQQARQNPANLNTHFYLYASWPQRPLPGRSFYGEWYNPDAVDPDADLIRNANGFNWIFDQLKADPDLQGVQLSVIPVGDVLAELDFRIRAGLVPSFTIANPLYRDELHLNNLARFAAANTVLATLFDQDPTGTPTNSDFDTSPFQPAPIEITPDLATAVQEAVWYVVDSYPLRGAESGDLNRDRFVGIEDLSMVLSNWNQSVKPPDPLFGDTNNDGFIGIEDLNKVLSNWNQNVTPGDASTGDLNNDGFVGIEDLSFILSEWNQHIAPIDPLPGDANGDGFVGIEDLNAVLGNWNAGTPPPDALMNAPEPGTLMLFAGVLGALATRRR